MRTGLIPVNVGSAIRPIVPIVQLVPLLPLAAAQRRLSIMPGMNPTSTRQGAMAEMAASTLRWLAGWWRILHLGAVIVALALSPSTYRRESRDALQHRLYADTAPNLLWFTVLSALLSLVLIRIVLVTAHSYGLSKYALQMVVRVLVMELIPLTTAVFVAMRCTIPHAAELSAMRSRGELEALRDRGADPVQQEVLPRVVAGTFAMLTLAAVSCALTLVLAYVSVYGASPWGFGSYTHTVGQVFAPAVAVIFALKIVLMSLAVSLIPAASALYEAQRAATRASVEMRGLVRMFLVLLLIEAASLVGNYY